MARPVKIASCAVEAYFEHGEREQALALVDRAGAMGADIVCLPEFAAADVDHHRFLPSAVPGPITDAFAALARRHGMYVVVPMVEDSGGGASTGGDSTRDDPSPPAKHYNTAVLLDRRGEIVGKYRKTHLCLPGYQEGACTLAGDELPVFATDFGVVGITICMDIHYPEVYAALALKGAEAIFWPTASMDYTGDLMESLVNARAIDNQVYMVPSHYTQLPYLVGKHYGRSRVVDCMGRIRADTGHFPGVALAEIDLDQTYPMWYAGEMLEAYPIMRETFFKTRRPELYGELVAPVAPGHYQRGNKAPPKKADPTPV